MKLSIIIVNFNTKDLIKKCVDGLFETKPNLSFEVVIVDNGSNDGSQEVIKKLSSKYRYVKYIFNTENLGFAKGNNIGIKASEGDYLLLLNSDTLIKKNSLEELVNFAEKNKLAGVVGAKLLNIDNTVQASAYKLPTLIRTIQQYLLNKKGLLDKYAPLSDNPVEVEAIVGAAFLITPAARKKVGLLDERYFMYFEDLDYCRRVKEKGLKVYYVPSSQIIHYHGASGKFIKNTNDQWRRLIPSSKVYHGLINYYLIFWVMKLSQFLAKIKV